MESVDSLLSQVRACTLCAAHLPLGPRPVLQFDPRARILIAGQAPGRKVHETGVPFNDASGERLRAWLDMRREVFYDARLVAIVPMGFCFPGTGKSGDLPPRPECAPAWRARLLERLPNLKLTLAVGRYALDYHLAGPRATLTEQVRAWRSHGPHIIALPHPSPRNMGWVKRNAWFEQELLPMLKARVAKVLDGR